MSRTALRLSALALGALLLSLAPRAGGAAVGGSSSLRDELARLGPAARVGAGQAAIVDGLPLDALAQSDLGVVNLTAARQRCAVSLRTSGGDALQAPVSFTLAPHESRPWEDLLAGVREKGRGDSAQASVSCSGDFYAYGLVTDRASGKVELVTPTGVTRAAAPAKTIPACPATAHCFDADGVVHVPSPADEVGRVAFPVPGGVATRLKLALDVTVADWYPKYPAGKHLIYWFVISRNVDMPGMLYFQGPPKSTAFARHGIGLKHPEKVKIIKSFAARVGHTYHVVNDYDMAGKSFTVTVTDLGVGPGVTLSGRPNVASYTFKAGQSFFVDMGFPTVNPAVNPTEVQSDGWKYANVHIEAYTHN